MKRIIKNIKITASTLNSKSKDIDIPKISMSQYGRVKVVHSIVSKYNYMSERVYYLPDHSIFSLDELKVGNNIQYIGLISKDNKYIPRSALLRIKRVTIKNR